MAKGHEKALAKAGVDADSLGYSYTNAINGFSAQLSYEEALALAGLDEVAMVLPDELLQPTTDSSGDFLEADVDVVVADLGLGRRRKNRLGQLGGLR